MVFAPLVAVSAVVIWIRFRLSERSVLLGALILEAFLVEAGTKTLVNGQPARQQHLPVMNRHERRRYRAQLVR